MKSNTKIYMKNSLVAAALFSSLSAVALANQGGDFLVRGGLTNVTPDNGKSVIMLAGENSTMTLTVDDNTQLGLNFVYFYNSNLAVEVLAATPFTHDVYIQDKNAVLGVDGAKLGKVTHLPPTVSALYYFNTNSAFKPYVGAGLNYTIFFNEKFTQAPKNLGLSNLSLGGSFGYSVQIGTDYEIDEKWSINASARYIDINSDATFSVNGDNIGKASIRVDPMVYSLMIGYKF